MKLFQKLFILLTVPVTLSAQNLVPNSSFEEFSLCPKSVTASKAELDIPGWTSPGTGTPDHFHRCANGAVDVPFNICGTSNPNSGQGYAGIFVWSDPEGYGEYREYLQCELAEPLVKGQKYKIKLFFKLASYSVYATGSIGVVLSQDRIDLNSDKVIDREPILESDDKVTLSPTGNWVELSGVITADGGEQFLVLGNFLTNEKTTAKKLPFKYGKSEHLNRSSYFFVDDVTLIPVETKAPLSASASYDPAGVALDNTYALRSTRFEFDGAVLFQSSYDELDGIVQYLKQNTLQVRLYGHVVSNRSDEFNNSLSAERARSIAQYLVDQGIDSRRIASYGYGKYRPVSMEMTEDAKKLNNRVEIKFVSN